MAHIEGCHPLYPYKDENKQSIRKELGLKDSTIQEDIDALIEWFEKQPHLIGAGLPDRDFLERMLINAKGSREKAKRRIDNFYRYRGAAPELIQNRDADLNSNRDIFSYYSLAISPKLFELKRISVVKFTDPDPNNYEIDLVLKNALMLADIRLKYDYMLSDILIIDLKNTGFAHLLRTNPVIFSKASRIFTDGVGIRIHAIHVLGAPSYAQQLIHFVSKFLKPKVLERIMFHDALEDLYKHVPKEYLPKDFGGDEPSMAYLKDKYLSFLRSEGVKQFLVEKSKQISDESLRPGVNIHDEYLNGSFKKLQLD